MNSRYISRAAVGLTIVALLALPGYGAFLTDWGAAGVQTVSDATNLGIDDSRDITDLYYTRDATAHFFRMDLRGAPTQSADEFAPEYSIQIDSSTGGGDSSETSFIAVGLTGIDQILQSSFTTAAGWDTFNRNNYLGAAALPPKVDTTDLSSIGGVFDFSESGGSILQWSIPLAQLNTGPFNFYAASQNINLPDTYDISSGISVSAVPEPGTLTMMGILGLLGAFIVGFSKREKTAPSS